MHTIGYSHLVKFLFCPASSSTQLMTTGLDSSRVYKKTVLRIRSWHGKGVLDLAVVGGGVVEAELCASFQLGGLEGDLHYPAGVGWGLVRKLAKVPEAALAAVLLVVVVDGVGGDDVLSGPVEALPDQVRDGGAVEAADGEVEAPLGLFLGLGEGVGRHGEVDAVDQLRFPNVMRAISGRTVMMVVFVGVRAWLFTHS